MIATEQTVRSLYQSGDPAHIAALQAFIRKDTDTMRSLADANEAHPYVQREAGRLAVDLRQPEAALRYLGAAFKVGLGLLNDPMWWNLMAVCQAQLGDYGEAEAAITMACKIAPRDALYWSTAAAFAYHRGDVLEASIRENEAIKWDAKDPEDRHAQGQIHLRHGRWKAGWPLYDGRLEARALQPHQTPPQWTGKPMRGQQLLIWSEQGQGDQIQFFRFLAHAKEASHAEITLLCYESLAAWVEPLLNDGTLAAINPTGSGEFHAQCSLLSLPRWLGITDPTDVPPPYAPSVDLAPREGLIGYCWRGNPQFANDLDRSCPSEGTFLHGLFEAEGEEIDRLNIRNLTKEDEDGPEGDWMQTARLIASCARIITVDTAIAHMAGSLGVKTTLIVASSPDWRWGIRGATTPWYPSMTIIRKRWIQGWRQAMTEAAATL